MSAPSGLWNADNRLENIYIAISGILGAGKSTLATALGAEMNLPVFYETVEKNAYLEDFYKDQKKYSFPLQVYLLNQRFAQQQQIVWGKSGAVQDRSIYEDSVFAKMLRDSGLMDPRDYETYSSLFTTMSRFMARPNVIVHLDVTPEESLARIKERARGMETGVSLEYLTALHAAYEEFLIEISRAIPVIRVDYSKYRTAEEMAKVVKREYEGLTNVRHVRFDSEQ